MPRRFRENAMQTSMQLPLACVLMETFRTLKRDLRGTYRPELHYMRGPGPKWRERHGLGLASPTVRQRRAGISH